NMYILSIDSGTTNSRIYLVDYNNQNVIDVVKKNIGIKNTAINGSNSVLKEEISNGIMEIIKRNNCTSDDINYIVASGMITSNLGILEVPYIESPCKYKDFST